MSITDSKVIEGVFYFENYVLASVDIDAIVQGSVFIHSNNGINKEAYKAGIYLPALNISNLDIKIVKESINIDETSLYNLLNDTHYSNDSLFLGVIRETDINPACETYYTKYRITARIVNAGDLMRRIPIFKDCKELEKYSDKYEGGYYEQKKVPLFLFVEILDYKRL